MFKSDKAKNIVYFLICILLLFCIFAMIRSILFRWRCVESKCERVLSLGFSSTDYDSRKECEIDCSNQSNQSNPLYSLKSGSVNSIPEAKKIGFTCTENGCKSEENGVFDTINKCNSKCEKQKIIDYSYAPYAYTALYPYSDYYPNTPYLPQSLQWLKRNDYAYNYPKNQHNHYIYNQIPSNHSNHNLNPNINTNPNTNPNPNPNPNPNLNPNPNPNPNINTNPNPNINPNSNHKSNSNIGNTGTNV